MSTIPILTLLIATPAIGALLIAFLKSNQHAAIRAIALGASLVTLAEFIYLWVSFQRGVPGLQFVEDYKWIPDWNIRYALGVDGISLVMVGLIALLVPFMVVYMWNTQHHMRGLAMCLLGMQAPLIGVFLANDLVLFYLFFELMLIPTWLAIGAFGTEDRVRAAMKFFIYTLVGGMAFLAGLIYIWMNTGTFKIDALHGVGLPMSIQSPVFWLFFLAFAIKLPLMPFHTWQANAYASAPIPIAVLLAAVMGKVGAYGFIRLNVGLLPEATEQHATMAGALAVLGIIVGAMIAAAQKDLKRLIAFSSLAHLGFIALGIFSATNVSMSGAVVQMVNHGITTAALFMLVGWLVVHSGTNRIADHGGIFTKAPALGGIFLFAIMASIAVPGLNGFPGEFSILVGSYPVLPKLTALAATGVILAAVYFLWAYQRAFFGPLRGASETMTDLTGPQRYLVYPLLVLMLFFGLYPAPLFNVVNPAVDHLLGTTATATAPVDTPAGAVSAEPQPAAPAQSQTEGK